MLLPTAESKGEKRPRVLYLTDKATEILRRLVAARPTGVVFTNTDGKAWTKQSLACVFGRLQVALGLKVMKATNVGPSPLPRFKRHDFADKEKLLAARGEQEAKIYERRKALDKLARTHAKKHSLYSFRQRAAARCSAGVDPVAIAVGHSDRRSRRYPAAAVQWVHQHAARGRLGVLSAVLYGLFHVEALGAFFSRCRGKLLQFENKRDRLGEKCRNRIRVCQLSSVFDDPLGTRGTGVRRVFGRTPRRPAVRCRPEYQVYS